MRDTAKHDLLVDAGNAMAEMVVALPTDPERAMDAARELVSIRDALLCAIDDKENGDR